MTCKGNVKEQRDLESILGYFIECMLDDEDREKQYFDEYLLAQQLLAQVETERLALEKHLKIG